MTWPLPNSSNGRIANANECYTISQNLFLWRFRAFKGPGHVWVDSGESWKCSCHKKNCPKFLVSLHGETGKPNGRRDIGVSFPETWKLRRIPLPLPSWMKKNLYPFFPSVSTVEELAERATALSFSDMYRCIVEREHHDKEEDVEGEKDCMPSMDASMEARGREDERLRALELISKAAEHEQDDPNMFDVSKYSCSCGNDCAKKLSRERFVRLVHSCREMRSLELRKFITHTLFPFIVYPTDDVIMDVMGAKTSTKRRKRSTDLSKRRASVIL